MIGVGFRQGPAARVYVVADVNALIRAENLECVPVFDQIGQHGCSLDVRYLGQKPWGVLENHNRSMPREKRARASQSQRFGSLDVEFDKVDLSKLVRDVVELYDRYDLFGHKLGRICRFQQFGKRAAHDGIAATRDSHRDGSLAFAERGMDDIDVGVPVESGAYADEADVVRECFDGNYPAGLTDQIRGSHGEDSDVRASVDDHGAPFKDLIEHRDDVRFVATGPREYASDGFVVLRYEQLVVANVD